MADRRQVHLARWQSKEGDRRVRWGDRRQRTRLFRFLWLLPRLRRMLAKAFAGPKP